MSGDPEQEHFCDGLVEDIITTLSKLAGLRVIARNSSFVYKGRSVDVREAAKQLGVRYVLEGSVRKSGNRIRITAQLIDAKDGAHLWAERYDRAMTTSSPSKTKSPWSSQPKCKSSSPRVNRRGCGTRRPTMSRHGPIGYKACPTPPPATKEKNDYALSVGKRHLRLIPLSGSQRHARFPALFGRPLRLVG